MTTIKLYHYTTKKGKDGIMSSKTIQSSTDARRDAILGKGVYLTDVSPWESNYKIAINNWDDGAARADAYVEAGRLDFAFEINIPENLVKVKKGDRSIYLYPEDLDLCDFPYKVYQRSEGSVELVASSG